VGAMPRNDGMERGDLLSANGGIFKPQGQALAASAKKDVKVLVVGNPANTNALIAMNNAKGLDPRRFTAMTRLDHNRAVSQLAAKLGTPVASIKKMTIWGNHSSTQYPDLFHCEVNGKNAAQMVNDQAWLDGEFIPTVAKRGAAIPCVCRNGEWSIVQGLEIDAYSRAKIDASVAELAEERDEVKKLGLI